MDKETRIKDIELTTDQVSQLLNVTMNTLSSWRVPKEGRNRYNLIKVVNFIRQREIDITSKKYEKQIEDLEEDLLNNEVQELIIRKKTAEANRMELRLLEDCKLLVDKKSTEEEFHNILEDIKNTLLNLDNISNDLENISALEIKQLLKEYIINSIETTIESYKSDENEDDIFDESSS